MDIHEFEWDAYAGMNAACCSARDMAHIGVLLLTIAITGTCYANAQKSVCSRNKVNGGVIDPTSIPRLTGMMDSSAIEGTYSIGIAVCTKVPSAACRCTRSFDTVMSRPTMDARQDARCAVRIDATPRRLLHVAPANRRRRPEPSASPSPY